MRYSLAFYTLVGVEAVFETALLNCLTVVMGSNNQSNYEKDI